MQPGEVTLSMHLVQYKRTDPRDVVAEKEKEISSMMIHLEMVDSAL